MKKQVMTWIIVVLVLNSLFATAESTSASPSGDSSSCNWWCKVKAVFSGNVVGKAGDIPTIAFPTDGKKITINGQAVNNWKDFTGLTDKSQGEYLEHLSPNSAQQILALIEPTRAKVLKDYLAVGQGQPQAEKLQAQLDYWTEHNTPLPDEMFKKTLTTAGTPGPALPSTSPSSAAPLQPSDLKPGDTIKDDYGNKFVVTSIGQDGNVYYDNEGSYIIPAQIGSYTKVSSATEPTPLATVVPAPQAQTPPDIHILEGTTPASITVNGIKQTVWEREPGKNCATDINDCGKVFDSQGNEVGIVYTGNNDYSPAPGFDWLYPKDKESMDVVLGPRGSEEPVREEKSTKEQVGESQTKSIISNFQTGKTNYNDAVNSLHNLGLTEAKAREQLLPTLKDVQEALQQKQITHGEAYDAMKSIADNDAAKAKQSDDSYKTLIDDIKSAGITLDKDGKIPSTASPDAVGKIGGIYLGISPNQPVETKISPQHISDFKTDDIVTIGDGEYKVGFVGKDGIQFYPQSQDQTDTIIYKSEKEFQQGVKDRQINIVRTTGESESSYLARVNAILEQQKSEPDKAQAAATISKQSAESMRWQGTWWDIVDNSPGYRAAKDVGSILTGGFELVGSLGSYRALSNLLFPDTTKEWSAWANSETLTRWADLPNFAAAQACGADDAKRANRPGQSAAFITTTAGTDQAVGAINAEKSPTKFPLLCRKNKADQWVCPKDLICKDNTYCYKDKNAEKPEEGYFYKITWGVTAPSDEKSTPYVDEDGTAAKFNVYLDTIPLYKKKGITEPKQVLQLTNGGHDGGMIVRYLPNDYNSVCIRFDKPIKDMGSDDINEICSTIIPTTGGVVEYAGSSKIDPVTSTSADVELDI